MKGGGGLYRGGEGGVKIEIAQTPLPLFITLIVCMYVFCNLNKVYTGYCENGQQQKSSIAQQISPYYQTNTYFEEEKKKRQKRQKIIRISKFMLVSNKVWAFFFFKQTNIETGVSFFDIQYIRTIGSRGFFFGREIFFPCE
jgi:hypothetical protein